MTTDRHDQLVAAAVDAEQQTAAALRALVETAAGSCEIVRALRRADASRRRTAGRIAAEIVAAVVAGDEMPEDWHRYDAYADIGEPDAAEVVRLVREELTGTGIRV